MVLYLTMVKCLRPAVRQLPFITQLKGRFLHSSVARINPGRGFRVMIHEIPVRMPFDRSLVASIAFNRLLTIAATTGRGPPPIQRGAAESQMMP